ncbi:hypothetical protein Nmel_015244, partial [Mimus melanotis]
MWGWTWGHLLWGQGCRALEQRPAMHGVQTGCGGQALPAQLRVV